MMAVVRVEVHMCGAGVEGRRHRLAIAFAAMLFAFRRRVIFLPVIPLLSPLEVPCEGSSTAAAPLAWSLFGEEYAPRHCRRELGGVHVLSGEFFDDDWAVLRWSVQRMLW